MRKDNFTQPAGGPLLLEVLGHAQYALRKHSSFNKPLYYKMNMGFVGEQGTKMQGGTGANKTGLHRPSYNLVVYCGDVPFFVGHYELDKRFSLEVSEEEAERIEDLMANDVTSILVCNGILFYITARHRGGLMSILRKESDDKKFLPLN